MKKLMVLIALVLAMCGPVPAAPPQAVSQEDQKAVIAVLQKLWDAYQKRDINAVMALEHEAVERQAAEVAKAGKVTAEDYRDALRGCTQDVLEHKDYELRPIEVDGLSFTWVGETLQVSNVVPIIATERVEIPEVGSVALRLVRFSFEKRADGWHIVGLDLQ